ncbi:MAG: hypothetical protein HZR80_06480 [Candidatus Heimdallarchaeota archaeon]
MKILFIEDEENEIEIFNHIFQKNKEIVFISKKPNELIKFLSSIDDIPDLFLVDYKLAEKLKANDPNNRFGGEFFEKFRHYYKEYPIILFSRFRDIDYSMIDLFDYYIGKKALTKNTKFYTNVLLEIANTFKELRKITERNRTKLFELIKTINTYEEDMLIESSLPISKRDIIARLGEDNLGDINIKDINKWNIPNVFEWLNKILFAYPGIFYDSKHASAHLRIGENSFKKKEIQEFFKEAKYSGIFHGLNERWWKGRLEEIAYKFLQGTKFAVNLDQFQEAFEEEYNVKLEPSSCICCKNPKANTICYVLKKPIIYNHSLVYNPDNRPGVMESARVSYEAILKGDKYNPEFIFSSDKKIEDNIVEIMKEIKGKKMG